MLMFHVDVKMKRLGIRLKNQNHYCYKYYKIILSEFTKLSVHINIQLDRQLGGAMVLFSVLLSCAGWLLSYF